MIEKLLVIINEMLEETDQKKLDDLQSSMSLKDELNFDSLQLAELTVRIEEEFGIDVFEDGIVQTIGEISSKLEGK